MWIEYYKNVLGLRFLPRPEKPRLRLVVVDLPHVPVHLKDNSLFQKMMTALGLRPEEYQVHELLPSEVESFRAPDGIPMLSFCEELTAAIKNLKSGPSLTTVKGPRELQQNPGLKKATWAGLQSLIQELSRSSKST